MDSILKSFFCVSEPMVHYDSLTSSSSQASIQLLKDYHALKLRDSTDPQQGHAKTGMLLTLKGAHIYFSLL